MQNTSGKVINRISENSIFNFIHQRLSSNNNLSLKFITLSIGYVDSNNLEWGIAYAIRSFHNFLDRQVTKKSIRHSLSVKSVNQYHEYRKNDVLQSLHGKKINELLAGGIYKIEYARNPKNPNVYNLHLHILTESNEFIPNSLISFLWKDVLSKPFQGLYVKSEGIANIQNVTTTENDIRKTFRYLVKNVPVLKDERFKTLRIMSKFGNWYSN